MTTGCSRLEAMMRACVALVVALVVIVSLAGDAIAAAAHAHPARRAADPTYRYDSPPAPTTRLANSHGVALVERPGPRASAGVVRLVSGFSLAAKAGDDALRTVAALTREQDAALAAAMRDPNKLRHIFGKPQHNLGPLARELGGQEALMREAVLAVPRGTTGTFEVTKRIGTYDLTVRGRVVDGVPRIGTVFVP